MLVVSSLARTSDFIWYKQSMPVHIFPTIELPPLCIVNGFPIYKYATYVYCRKKRQLHLIRPHYHRCLPADIQQQLLVIPAVKIQGVDCTSMIVTMPRSCQHSYILTINIPESVTTDQTIPVSIGDYEFIAHAIDPYMGDMVQDVTTCTLFKHDYKNTRLYIDYYYNYHGIKSYLLYYNGRIEVLREYLDALTPLIPTDCNVVFFGFDFPYWQTFCGKNDITQFWAHSAQSIQLTHSAIVADSWSKSLMNVDYDEYLKPDVNFRDLLATYNAVLFQYTSRGETSRGDTCGGALCLRDYDYAYTDIITNIRIGRTAPVNYKYIENTLDRGIYNRNVHTCVFKDRICGLKRVLYHIMCLSYDSAMPAKKRCCVTPPSSP